MQRQIGVDPRDLARRSRTLNRSVKIKKTGRMTKKQISEAKRERTAQLLHQKVIRAAQVKVQHHKDVVIQNRLTAFSRRKEGSLADIIARQSSADVLVVPSTVSMEAFVRAATKVWVMRSDTHPTGYSIHKVRTMYAKAVLEGDKLVMRPKKLVSSKPYRVGDFIHSKVPVEYPTVYEYVPNNGRAKKAFKAIINTGREFVFYAGHQERNTTVEDLMAYIRTHLSLHDAPQEDELPRVNPVRLAASIPLPPPKDREIQYLQSGGEINPGPVTEEEWFEYFTHGDGALFYMDFTGADESDTEPLPEDQPYLDVLKFLISGGEINPGPPSDTKRRISIKRASDAAYKQRERRKKLTIHRPGDTPGASTSASAMPGQDGTEKQSRVRLPIQPELGQEIKSHKPTKPQKKKAHKQLIDKLIDLQAEEAEDQKSAASDVAADAEDEERKQARSTEDEHLRNIHLRNVLFTVPNLDPHSFHLCSATLTMLQSALGLEAQLPHTECVCSYTRTEVQRCDDLKVDLRNPGLYKYSPHDKVIKYAHFAVDVITYGLHFEDEHVVTTEELSVPIDFLYLCFRRRIYSAGTFYGSYILARDLAKEYVADYVPNVPELEMNLFHRDLLVAALCFTLTRPANLSWVDMLSCAAKETIDSEFYKAYVKDHPAVGGTYAEGYKTKATSVFKAGEQVAEKLSADAGLLKIKMLNQTKEMKKRITQWRLYKNWVSIPSAPGLTPRNNLLGIVKRLLGKTPEPTPEMVEVGEAITDELLRECVDDDAIPTVAELEDAAAEYPESARPEFLSGANLVRSVLETGNTEGVAGKELSSILESKVGIFTKAECYAQGENKAPRMIVAPAMKVRGALYAMYSKAAKKLNLLLSQVNVKGLTMGQIGEKMKEKFSECATMAKTDHTSFEATIVEGRRILENKFCASGFRAILKPFYDKMRGAFEMANGYYDVVSSSIRRSGEYFTSSGNQFQNYVFYVQILAKSLDPRKPAAKAVELVRSGLNGFHALFEGDDGLCEIPPGVTETDLNAAAIQAGARLKLELVHDFEDVAFCKIRFSSLALVGDKTMRFAFKDPVAIIAKLGTNMDPDRDTACRDDLKQFAAALSNLMELPRHPLSTSYARGILKCAKNLPHVKALLSFGENADTPLDFEFQFVASPYARKRGVSVREVLSHWAAGLRVLNDTDSEFAPDDASYAAVERVYGYSTDTMKRLEHELFAYAAGMITERPDLSALETPHNMQLRSFDDARKLARDVGSGIAAVAQKSATKLREGLPLIKPTLMLWSMTALTAVGFCMTNPFFWIGLAAFAMVISMISALVSYALGASPRRCVLFFLGPPTLLFISILFVPIVLLLWFRKRLNSALTWASAPERTGLIKKLATLLF